MKALSIRQPWAELILQGRKTIELRTWPTNYRGRIAIHAGQTLKEAACAAYGLDPASLTRGALVGTVEIVEMVTLDDQLWEALRDQHLGLGPFPGDLLGWRLANPQRLPEPIPMPGHLGLFSIPDELVLSPRRETMPVSRQPKPQREPKHRKPTPVELYQVGAEVGCDPEKPFELRVVPRNSDNYSLALYQWPVAANSGPTKPQRLVELAGDSLRAVADHVLEALRKAGYKATDLSRERRQPFRLDEETGVRLGLLFLTIKPLTRLNRVEVISIALRAMPSEEAYYWFSKCTAEPNAVNAQRALRILLSGE